MKDIQTDRLAQLLLKSDPKIDVDAARLRLERASVVLSINNAASQPWAQAAILTAAESAVRMFRGGVYLQGILDVPLVVGTFPRWTLRHALMSTGCRADGIPTTATSVHVGPENLEGGDLYCWADGWLSVTSGHPAQQPVALGNELSGAVAGAMVISEVFRESILQDVRAGQRTQRLSVLAPERPTADGIGLKLLPSRIWLVGVGNLGQAVLWLLGLLPYADPSRVELWLQDHDKSGPENLDIQVLTKHAWVGHQKARAAAAWAEQRGFQTLITEQTFTADSKRSRHEPGLAIVGVDNLEARQFVASRDAGFDLVVDAGLGASAQEIFDIRVHRFPGSRAPAKAWPTQEKEKPDSLTGALQKLVDQGRLDRCGALTIAGQSVGVPTTAIVAAAIQIAQVCRVLEGGECCDLVDLSLVAPHHATGNPSTLETASALPSVHAR